MYAFSAGGRVMCTFLLKEKVIMIIKKKKKGVGSGALYSTHLLVMEEVKVRKPFFVKVCTSILWVAGEFLKCVSLLKNFLKPRTKTHKR